MIYGVGTDIVEISRIKRIIERSPLFIEKVFTSGEREYCLRKKHAEESWATRFAAKEAVLKAFGTGLSKYAWRDVEIINRENGQPEVILHGELEVLARRYKVRNIRISLSHSNDSAIAFALVETKED